MKLFLILLLAGPVSAIAQPPIKNILLDGSGRPLVMLPGAVALITTLQIPAQGLAAQYKVVRMENLNVQYAANKKQLPQDYSIQMESESVKATLDSLKITEPVVLVGSSYGGIIALDFALRFPERTQALVMLEPVLFGLLRAKNESSATFEHLQQVTRQLKPQAEITEEMVEQWRCLGMNCDSVAIRTLPQWPGWVQTRDRLRGLSATLDYQVQESALRAFSKPVLIVTGTRTRELNRRIDELLKAEMPTAQSVFVNSGHSIPTTAPQELVKAILEFLK